MVTGYPYFIVIYKNNRTGEIIVHKHYNKWIGYLLWYLSDIQFPTSYIINTPTSIGIGYHKHEPATTILYIFKIKYVWEQND